MCALRDFSYLSLLYRRSFLWQCLFSYASHYRRVICPIRPFEILSKDFTARRYDWRIQRSANILSNQKYPGQIYDQRHWKKCGIANFCSIILFFSTNENDFGNIVPKQVRRTCRSHRDWMKFVYFSITMNTNICDYRACRNSKHRSIVLNFTKKISKRFQNITIDNKNNNMIDKDSRRFQGEIYRFWQNTYDGVNLTPNGWR